MRAACGWAPGRRGRVIRRSGARLHRAPAGEPALAAASARRVLDESLDAGASRGDAVALRAVQPLRALLGAALATGAEQHALSSRQLARLRMQQRLRQRRRRLDDPLQRRRLGPASCWPARSTPRCWMRCSESIRRARRCDWPRCSRC
ncbi:MAG: hypothetical protein MZW92_54030 [Comamonadaceae bacterium]|nr:hypothetical protein [Comamonadaceae bacterium]